MSSEIYRGHLLRAGQIWRGPRRIYPRDRRMVRNVTVYLSRNKPICRQLQPYRLHFRNSGSKQITHLKDNCYTIYLSTNLLEKNQKTLSTKLPVYSLWEPNLPYQIKIAHLFMRSITKCPCYLKCQGLVNHEITRQRRNTESWQLQIYGSKTQSSYRKGKYLKARLYFVIVLVTINILVKKNWTGDQTGPTKYT